MNSSGVVPALRAFSGKRNAVLKDPLIVFVDFDLLARSIRRFEVTPYTKLARWVDAPRKLDPEFVFFPHLAGVRFISEIKVFPFALAQNALNRLAKRDPLIGVSLLTHHVVTLGA